MKIILFLIGLIITGTGMIWLTSEHSIQYNKQIDTMVVVSPKSRCDSTLLNLNYGLADTAKFRLIIGDTTIGCTAFAPRISASDTLY